MGSRNLDRITMAQWRARCPTVAAMAAERWTVEARCGGCRAARPVDLEMVGLRRGPLTCLWNRGQPCKGSGCGGQVSFWARIPGLYRFQPLQAPDHVPHRETLGEKAARERAERGEG